MIISIQKPSGSFLTVLVSFLITVCIEGFQTISAKSLSTTTMKNISNSNGAAVPFSTSTKAQRSSSSRFVTAIHLMPHYECAAAAVMSGLGDILAQLMLRRRDPSKKVLPFDYKRTLQFMMKGIGEGFLWTLWYRWADRSCLLVTRALAGDLQNSALIMKILGTVVAIVMDLCLACPFIYSCWDIPFPAWIRGTPVRMIPHKIREKLPEMLLASIKVWTPVNVLIYNAPVQYRPYIMSVADVFWQSIVSSIVISAAVSVSTAEGGLEVVALTASFDEGELKQHL